MSEKPEAEKAEKTHRIGLRTTHGRPFWRCGTAIQPKGTTHIEVTAAQAKTIERECAAEGSVLELVEPAKPIEKPKAPAADKDDKSKK